MKRILCVIFLTALVFMLTVSVFAESTQTEGSAELNEKENTTTSGAPDTSLSAQVTVTIGENEGADRRDEESFAEYAVQTVIERIPEILSLVGIALTGALCVAVKRSVIPAISEGIRRLAEICGKDAKITDDFIRNADERLAMLEKKSGDIKSDSNSACVMISELNEKISLLANEKNSASKEREIMKRVMLAQAEMFDKLVSTSAIPQWKKDELAKEFAYQKSEINRITESEENE